MAITAILVLSGFVTTVFSQGSSPRDDLAWQITVDGAVQNPLQLNLAELIEMPRTTVRAELTCYGLPLANGDWTGVRLWLVLEKAGIIEQNVAVTFIASDGYEIKDFPMNEAKREDVLLAYELDGQSLPETIRLVVPGANGNVWIKWITKITVKLPSTEVSPVLPQSEGALPFSQNLTLQEPSKPALNVSIPQQPENQSGTELPEPQSTSQPAEQLEPVKQEVADSTKPLNYSYVLVAVVVAAGVAAGIVIVKRRKIKQQ